MELLRTAQSLKIEVDGLILAIMSIVQDSMFVSKHNAQSAYCLSSITIAMTRGESER